MESLKEYLKSKGKIKVKYENHKKALIELKIDDNIFWIIKYISHKNKTIYGLGILVPAGKLGWSVESISLESKVLKNQRSLRKEIEKIREPPENRFKKSYIGSNSMEHIL